MSRFRLAFALWGFCGLACAAESRARDPGVPFEGASGPLNAITDVAGVSVGQVTLIEDLANGHKVRTALPRSCRAATPATTCPRSARGLRSTATAR